MRELPNFSSAAEWRVLVNRRKSKGPNFAWLLHGPNTSLILSIILTLWIPTTRNRSICRVDILKKSDLTEHHNHSTQMDSYLKFCQKLVISGSSLSSLTSSFRNISFNCGLLPDILFQRITLGCYYEFRKSSKCRMTWVKHFPKTNLEKLFKFSWSVSLTIWIGNHMPTALHRHLR